MDLTKFYQFTEALNNMADLSRPLVHYPLKKLMLCTWFGELPPWYLQFKEHTSHQHESGWDFILIENRLNFAHLVKERLNVKVPLETDTRKPGDYRPYLGFLFPELLKGYDFWGQFDLDCVYGRLDRWLPDSFLEHVDVFGNDLGKVCGPFTLYRNCEKVNRLFERSGSWRSNLKIGTFLGWDEDFFSVAVETAALQGQIRFASAFFQAHDVLTKEHIAVAEKGGPVKILNDGTLVDNVTGEEIMMYHFNHTRRWPVA